MCGYGHPRPTECCRAQSAEVCGVDEAGNWLCGELSQGWNCNCRKFPIHLTLYPRCYCFLGHTENWDAPLDSVHVWSH